MDFPVPVHLQSNFKPIGNENDEYEVKGSIHCLCGSESFEIWESNDRNIIRLKCKQCGEEFILFDSGKHGWNGFVCKDDFNDRECPFSQYVCEECEHDSFKICVTISSQGKDDFMEECVSNDDSFTIDDWVNAFEWITVSLSCENCTFEDSKWLDMETM